MKRREYFPDYDGAERYMSRRDRSDDGRFSDDGFKRQKLHKEHSAKWNDDHHRSRVFKKAYAPPLSEDSDSEVSSYKDLCITYIPSRISNSDLEDGLLLEFEKYGRVSVKIINEGIDRQAYIRFIDSDDARRAYSSIEKNPLLLDNRRVEVKPCYKQTPSLDRPVKKPVQHKSPSEGSHSGRYRRRSISPKSISRIKPRFDDTEYTYTPISREKRLPAKIAMVTPTRVLFVGKLPSDIKKNTLQTLFEECGRIEDIDIKYSKHLGQSRAFAFIKYSNIDSAQKARDLFQNTYIGGKPCKIGFGHVDADVIREKEAQTADKERSTSQKTFTSLCVQPIPDNFPVSQLQEIFEGFGAVNIKIPISDRERVAYINFQYAEDAQAAYKGSRHLTLAGCPVKVSPCYKPCDGDEEENNFVQYMASATPTKLLFVGNLDSGILKNDLMKTFSKFGSIDHIDMKETALGKMYAIVKFKSLSECIKANREMFGKKIGGQVWKIGYAYVAQTNKEDHSRKHELKSKTESKEKRPQITGLCFRYITKAASDKLITSVLQSKYKTFYEKGQMTVSIKMSGKYKVAFVYFKTINQATKAWKAKINVSIMKKPVKISPIIVTKRTLHRTTDKKATTSSEEVVEPELDEKATRTLFIGNLSRDIQEKDVYKHFKTYGDIEFVTIKRPKGNISYAFVKYVNMDYAYKAKVEMNGKMFKNCKLNIGYGRSDVTSCLWVGGLGPWVDEETIQKEFSRFGDIRRMIWQKGSTFAYVQYETNDAAQAACQKFHGWPMGGLDKRLRVDFVSVKQILTALEKSKSLQEDDEHAKNETGHQCEAVSEISLESSSALGSTYAVDSEAAMGSEPAGDSEAELSMSNISDDSYSEDFISTRSLGATSRSPSVNSERQSNGVNSGRESAENEESGEASLLIKTPFSPADEMSYSERVVFVQSKGRHGDNDHTHRQISHRKPSPDTRDLLSSRRIDESLQREIKHYRRESGMSKHSTDSYYKSASSSNDDKHNDGSRLKDLYSKHDDRLAIRAEEHRREPETRRYDSGQYIRNLAAKQYGNKEYERREETHKYVESSLFRHDFVDREEKPHLSAEKLPVSDLEKLDYYKRRFDESSHEKQSRELPPVLTSKTVDYGHGIMNYSSSMKEHTTMGSVEMPPDFQEFKRPLQYDSPNDYQRPVPARLSEQGPAAAYKNPSSGSSLESLRIINRLPSYGNPSGITAGNIEQRPPVIHYPESRRPISYGDPSYGSHHEQPFQQTLADNRFMSQKPLPGVSGVGIQQMNTPRMLPPGRTLFPVGQFAQTLNTNSNRPALNKMSAAPNDYSRTNSFKMGRQGIEIPYSMMNRQPRDQSHSTGSAALPCHIQQ